MFHGIPIPVFIPQAINSSEPRFVLLSSTLHGVPRLSQGADQGSIQAIALGDSPNGFSERSEAESGDVVDDSLREGTVVCCDDGRSTVVD